MRLLHTTKLVIVEFEGPIPDYAILSHRWEQGEVTFQQMQNGKAKKIMAMPAFKKIAGCCAQAAADGYDYVWIDTCCIDKSSSAELSEAINSMFKWYQDAKVCYAYLSDVSSGDGDPWTEGSEFRRSKWFTRGWTLQELIAPKSVVFFNADWIKIGMKDLYLEEFLDDDLSLLVEDITRITHLDDFSQASIAEKFSWASTRTTTRPEDTSYCLMGLFGVNMSPLYGEGGAGAFLRLQLEIIKMSDDQSIFAWYTPDCGCQDCRELRRGGLFATSLHAFAEQRFVRNGSAAFDSGPYTMTNKGLRMETHLAPIPDSLAASLGVTGLDHFLLRLNCSQDLALCLERAPSKQTNKFIRAFQKRQFHCGGAQFEEKIIYITQSSVNLAPQVVPVRRIQGVLQLNLSHKLDFRVIRGCYTRNFHLELVSLGAPRDEIPPRYRFWIGGSHGSSNTGIPISRLEPPDERSCGALLFQDMKTMEQVILIIQFLWRPTYGHIFQADFLQHNGNKSRWKQTINEFMGGRLNETSVERPFKLLFKTKVGIWFTLKEMPSVEFDMAWLYYNFDLSISE